MSKLRIGVDGLGLIKKEPTGISTYFFNALEGIGHYPEVELYIFYPYKRLNVSSLFPQRKNLHYICLPPLEFLSFDTFLHVWYDWLLAWAKKAYRLHLFHGISCYLPRKDRCRQVLTLHHLWPEELGRYGIPSLDALRKHVQRADKIITDSYASKKSLLRHLGLEENKVSVVYASADPFFHKISSPGALQAFREKHGIQKKFILYVGLFAQRKNIEGMLNAFKDFSRDFPEYEFIIAGKDIGDNIKEALKLPGVRYWGYSSKEDLLYLYNGAEFLLFIPFEEGFGFPTLEALRCGCPALLSDIEVFHEVVGEHAFYCDHRNTKAVVEAMKILATNEEIRKRIIHNAFRLLEKFTPEAWVKQIIATYKDLTRPASFQTATS